MSGLLSRASAAVMELLWPTDEQLETNAIEAMSKRKKAGITAPRSDTSVVMLMGGIHDGEYRFLSRSIDTITLQDSDGFDHRYVRSGPNHFILQEKAGAP